MSNKIDELAKEVKNTFNDYFSMVGSKNFKQFYYDWHIDNMTAPFAGLVDYFAQNYGKNAKDSFNDFTKDVIVWLETFDVDKPEIAQISVKKYSKTKDGKLKKIIDGVRTFGFECRPFIYNFATLTDHTTEFGHWPVKANMLYSCKQGLMIAKDIITFLNDNYDKIAGADNVYMSAQKAVDTYIRNRITKNYAYKSDYTFEDRKKTIKKLHDLRNYLSLAFNKPNNDFTEEQKNLFQIENKEAPKVNNLYWPNGFELEFYVPETLGNYDVLAEYLKEKNKWKRFYFSNDNPDVYKDKEAAGVIMRDESLASHNGLSPVEFASRVMYSKEDENVCLQILDAFDKGHVNKHCSLHQHLSSQGMDLDAYKRLVKRMIMHEEQIVGAFAAPERQNNNLLYATYISRNLSSQSKRDYPFLALMVDICENKTELQEMVSFGNKYKTLNIMPQNTVEMRAMNANFNKKFVEGYLQFNREFIASAVANNPHHINHILLNKYTWYNNEQSDTKTVMHRLNYKYDDVPHDSYRPMKRPVPTDVIKQEQNYLRLVSHALGCTKKLPYNNPYFNKRVQEARGL